ncbi:MAG: dihydroorotase [Burkholderiales bacterium]|nr:dihydroorotase [Burkholderiales bacterium]
MKIAIRNGRLIDPASGSDRQADVFIAAGRIVAIGEAPADWHGNRDIDASGCIVAPGLVDLAVHVKRGTLATEMAAAAAGGVTSMVCSPDTDPVLDEPGLVDMLRWRAQSFHGARLHPLGALTKELAGEQLAELSKLSLAGCIAFSQADKPIVDHQVLLRAMQYATTFGFAVWLRPEETHLAKGGVAHEGEMATRLGLAGIPSSAEIIALATHLELARVTGTRLHVCRVSTADAVDMLREAKRRGVRVSADVAVHQLHLTDVDIGHFDTQCRLTPPLRSARDRDALRAGVLDGTIDAIVSDHTPRPDGSKQLPFAEAAPGASGLETLLSLTLRFADAVGVDPTRALAWITLRPAEVANLAAGRIALDAPADLCVFDATAYRIVHRAGLRSAGKNSPFLGYELPGVVRATVAGGHIAYEAAA